MVLPAHEKLTCFRDAEYICRGLKNAAMVLEGYVPQHLTAEIQTVRDLVSALSLSSDLSRLEHGQFVYRKPGTTVEWLTPETVFRVCILSLHLIKVVVLANRWGWVKCSKLAADLNSISGRLWFVAMCAQHVNASRIDTLRSNPNCPVPQYGALSELIFSAVEVFGLVKSKQLRGLIGLTTVGFYTGTIQVS